MDTKQSEEEGNNKKRKTSHSSSTLERSLTKKRRKPGECVRPNTRKSANTFSKAPRLFYRYCHPSLPFPPLTVIIQLVTLSPRVAAAAQKHYYNIYEFALFTRLRVPR